MMPPAPQNLNFRTLMTIDAVGGVWRYALDLAAGLRLKGGETVFVGFGPRPSAAQVLEAEQIGKLIWCDAPLDWMAERGTELQDVPGMIRDLARLEMADIVHLNLPSQAAGFDTDVPVVVVSHSCVGTWFHGVRGHEVPGPWQWQLDLNRKGFQRADVVISPSRSHADLLESVYGPIGRLQVVHNASRVSPAPGCKEDLIFAAGRWWDDGKNGSILDAAAEHTLWPVMMAGATRGPNGQSIALRHAIGREEISHEEAMAAMGKAGIFVSPSVYEPFGLAALEAARCGCALVLADIPTYRELWEGVAQFVDPHDAHGLVHILNRLAIDVAGRARLGQLCLARSQRFTVEAQTDALIRVYGNLLSSVSVLGAAE